MSRDIVLIALISSVAGALQACSPNAGGATPQSTAALSSTNLVNVQAAIQSAGANWTPVEPGRVYQLGVPLSRLPAGPLMIQDDNSAGLPSSFDWRNNNGKNYVSPVLDQGSCGSCVAFATIGTFETQLNIAAADTASPHELSPEYLFACGGGACGFGWDNDSASQFVASTGVPDDACMPYTSGAAGQDGQCGSACSDASRRSIVAAGVTTPTSGGGSLTAVKTALMSGPLATTMTVYEDFFYYKSGVYKHVTGQVAGGHSVSIVGWNDNDKAWIVRNSWGADWGMNGFFEIAYTDISGVGQQTWGFTLPAPGPYVAVTGIRDNALLSGKNQALTFDVQGAPGASLNWTLSQGSQVFAQANIGTATSTTFDTTTVPDGTYTLQAFASGGAASLSSEPRIVYVLNGTETGGIQFSGITNGQKVNGTVTVNMTASYSPIPFTQIQVSISDASGKPVSHFNSGNVGQNMAFDWDTTRRPNGNYTLTVVGMAGTQSTAASSVTVAIQN
jgi:C1A family cysteine protease